MKARIKFSKVGTIKFIGHLDLMRTFQKIFRRSELPVAYSEGFNPHQIFSIAAPLALGVTSNGEYLDVKFTKELNPTEIKDALNSTCPEGIEVLEVIPLSEDEPAAMASVGYAKYKIKFSNINISENDIDNFLNNEEIIIKKKSKKGRIKDLNIRPGIHSISLDEDNLIMVLATGSKLNIKPEFCLQTLCDYLKIEYNRFNYQFHREELYYDSNLTPLSIPKKGSEDFAL